MKYTCCENEFDKKKGSTLKSAQNFSGNNFQHEHSLCHCLRIQTLCEIYMFIHHFWWASLNTLQLQEIEENIYTPFQDCGSENVCSDKPTTTQFTYIIHIWNAYPVSKLMTCIRDMLWYIFTFIHENTHTQLCNSNSVQKSSWKWENMYSNLFFFFFLLCCPNVSLLLPIFSLHVLSLISFGLKFTLTQQTPK